MSVKRGLLIALIASAIMLVVGGGSARAHGAGGHNCGGADKA